MGNGRTDGTTNRGVEAAAGEEFQCRQGFECSDQRKPVCRACESNVVAKEAVCLLIADEPLTAGSVAAGTQADSRADNAAGDRLVLCRAGEDAQSVGELDVALDRHVVAVAVAPGRGAGDVAILKILVAVIFAQLSKVERVVAQSLAQQLR